jgi:UDP-glucose 6-dehydrogenase
MTNFTHKTLLPLCGKCLPKDTLALKELAQRNGVDYDILEAIQSDNAALRKIFTGKSSDVVTGDD